jgi:carbon-monoxide dehydrogenase large subunit
MNDLTPTREQRTAALEGMGCKRKRVEDIRFTQGKGNYVDDVKLPGMLHGDFVRSPHAHARVKSINSEEALKVPGVLAVITAETLKTVNLAWMPTRMRLCCARTSPARPRARTVRASTTTTFLNGRLATRN